MTQPIVISLYSMMSSGHPFAFMTSGMYTADEDGTIALDFEEAPEFGPAGPMARISFHDNGMLSVGRSDFTYMQLNNNQWFCASFCEAGSNLNLSVYPTRLEYQLSPDEGYLDMHYQMNVGEMSSHVQMLIQYQSCEVTES